MEKNLKKFALKTGIFVGLLLLITFAFRFPIDYFGLSMFGMNTATTIFSKSDGIKILALSALFFTLYCKDALSDITHSKQKKRVSALYILIGLTSVAGYYFLKFIANKQNINSGADFHALFFLSIILLASAFISFALGVFSLKYLKKIYAKLRIPVIVFAGFAVAAYFLLAEFQNLWPYFSRSISKILYSWFSLAYPTYLEMGSIPLLDVNGFAVSIGAACSGIESIFLFSAFSIGIYALDHKRLNKKLFLFSSMLGLVGIYFVNIVRLFLLILAGIYISPEFAVGIFHTNVGWILFALYFILYYFVTKHFLYKDIRRNRSLSRYKDD